MSPWTKIWWFTCLYYTSSLVLMTCLICTACHHLYWWWPNLYCMSSLALKRCLIHNVGCYNCSHADKFENFYLLWLKIKKMAKKSLMAHPHLSIDSASPPPPPPRDSYWDYSQINFFPSNFLYSCFVSEWDHRPRQRSEPWIQGKGILNASAEIHVIFEMHL